ncbi:MAG: hypothetical protein J7500_11915 [Sphingomonas sp.]|uniref:DUF6683 family protein n=1 Tax=Sphingomonas sp. TaxID=28214 RepID=UPI001B136AC4|nr:DUF6683 family protein [Sphingomonas sp.]MBO9623406.1 hypothetical protein [Sphingomonas sp.]
MKRALSLLLGLTLLWPAAASAQDMGWSTIIPSVTGTDTLGLRLRDQMRGDAPRGEARRRGSAQEQQRFFAAPTGAPAAADLAELRFSPSKSRRAANLAQFVSKTRKIDAGNAQDLERLFAQGDFIERLGKSLAPLGLGVDNVADAYAIWMISAWNATQGRNDTPSRGTAQAVRAQMARALGSAREIASANDAAKQELAEALLVQTALVDAAVDQNRSNPGRMQQFGAAVNQGAKRMGIDLTTMALTEHGFVPASAGSTVAPALPGESRKARAAFGSDATTLLYAPAALAALGGVGGLIWLTRGRG